MAAIRPKLGLLSPRHQPHDHQRVIDWYRRRREDMVDTSLLWENIRHHFLPAEDEAAARHPLWNVFYCKQPRRGGKSLTITACRKGLSISFQNSWYLIHPPPSVSWNESRCSSTNTAGKQCPTIPDINPNHIKKIRLLSRLSRIVSDGVARLHATCVPIACVAWLTWGYRFRPLTIMTSFSRPSTKM